jgi:hypothetical protein
MAMPRIIGFTGVAGCGKNTAAAQFREIYPSYQERAFADPIKEMLRKGVGLDNQQLNGVLKEEIIPEFGVSPRTMMQTLGTEWGRHMMGGNFWLTCMKRRIHPTENVVITDVRFQNEAEYVRENGLLVHIMGRGGIEGGHASEAGVEPHDGDYYIYNDGTYEDLYMKIELMLKEID